jgi:hypothetical protein
MISQTIAVSRLEYAAYVSEVWLSYYFDESSGGYVVINRRRIARALASKNERKKFEQERSMALVFARGGYRMVMLEEVPRVSSPDVLINGIPAELKNLNSPGTIVKSAKKAVRHQGAEIVLFQLIESEEAHKQLLVLKETGIRAFYYFSTDASMICEL